MLFRENFPTANHMGENTICDCNTVNPWPLQHNDTAYFWCYQLATMHTTCRCMTYIPYNRVIRRTSLFSAHRLLGTYCLLDKINLHSSEVTMIPWSCLKRAFITSFNFDPGHKCFYMGYTSDYPLQSAVSAWKYPEGRQLKLKHTWQLCMVNYVNYGPWETNFMADYSKTIYTVAEVTLDKGHAQTMLQRSSSRFGCEAKFVQV